MPSFEQQVIDNQIIVTVTLSRGQGEPRVPFRALMDTGAQGTADVLRDHREFQQVVKEVMSPAYDDRGRVFANEFGDWIRPHSLTNAVKGLGARVGFPRMTVHSLLHFHASVPLQTGQNIVVSKRLGHSDVSITSDIYALPGWQRQAADAFADAMEKGG